MRGPSIVTILSTAVLLAALSAAAVAADPPALPPVAVELDGPGELSQSGPGGSIQSGIVGCVLWTDRCTVCQRADGVVACSNIGVACQPEAPICLREEAAPAKKPDTEKADTAKPGTEKAGTEKAGTEKAGTEKAGTEKTGTEKADTGKADTEKKPDPGTEPSKGPEIKPATDKKPAN